jgi:structural maintenance of chromosome 3 (chondroitin sulfate proteoglycan 6)
MNETNNKREKIDELLEYIKERLSELEEEKEELKDYQDKDKERRCLQYTIDHREQVAISNELDSLDELRQNGVDDTDENRQRYIEGEETLASINAEINKYRQQIELLKLDKRQLESERREAVKEKAKIELELKSLSDGQAAAQQTQDYINQEVQRIQGAIYERENVLAQVTPEFNAQRNDEVRLKGELETAEATRQRLYAKQGRNSRFKSKKERDDWLRKEINDGYPQIAQIKAVRMQTTEEITALEQDIALMEASIAGLREQFENRGSKSDEMQAQLQEYKSEKERLTDERK